ncbi:MAG: NAD(P)/FAD-dependent oxidoreductase [Proteobacteria bacterium]|nr:NAD(P)/FAD-dependent oxidoreductase [Pseudomonadota bacterium]
MSDYDLCVIGAGPSGYAAAVRAWDFGKKVALVDKGPLGGAGIHHGALSSKTLWELSKDYRKALHRDRGFVAESVSLDWGQVLHCVEQAVDEKVEQLQRQLDALSRPGHDHPGSIEFIHGAAHFESASRVRIEGGDQGMRTLTADHFAVATGSRPRELPEIPVDGRTIITSDHIGGLKEFPRSLVILGAGVVGCEFATIFANYGQTKVYVIDRADRILPFEDEDVARVCSRNLENKGVTVHHRCRLVSMEVVGPQVEYTIEHHTGGREAIRVDKALISIGRVPNTGGMGLEEIGVKLDDRGYIADDDGQTTVPGIWAVGDITRDLALVSVGEEEGRHAIERIWGGRTVPMSKDNFSTIYFLDPEVATVGLSEQEAQKQRIPYKVAVYGYGLVNRAIAMRARSGFVKILTTDCDDMKILGMRALGVHASTTIEAVALVMQHGRSVRELANLLHPHPAVTECVQDCVRMLLGTSIHKPHVFQSELRLSQVSYEADGTTSQLALRPVASK